MKSVNRNRAPDEASWDLSFQTDPQSSARSMAELFHLLEAIDREGSIRKASMELGFSYRHSWDLLKDAQTWFGTTLLETSVGGKKGGGALLTRSGRSLTQSFLALGRSIETSLAVYPGLTRKRPQKETAPFQEKQSAYLVLASTMEPAEAGLLDLLERHFLADTGIFLRHIAAGSGQALDFAREGRVDMTLTHSPAAEKEFMEEGLGCEALELMESPFILAGPTSCPVSEETFRLKGKSLGEQFREIADRKLPFISRGDDSGTHRRELEIWNSEGIVPKWAAYTTAGSTGGNSGLIREAAAKRAFCLTDLASFISLSPRDKTAFTVFKGPEYDPFTLNIYQLITVNQERFSYVHAAAASIFREWVDRKGRSLIAGFENGLFKTL
jgi:tungstate transport system substrate-binding protein